MNQPAREIVGYLGGTKLGSRSFWSVWAARLAGAVLGVVSLAWIGRLVATGRPVSGAWVWQFCWAGTTLFCIVLIAIEHWRHWYRPRQRLRELIRMVRDGVAPIEELSSVNGAMTDLVADVQGILRELREQKVEIATLQQEMGQRVARRTTALERTIGTLRNQATRDPLTGLYNRRMLDQHLPLVMQQCRADRSQLCVLMADVDYFKQLNDTLGHAAGDELLKSVSQIIRSTLREEDLAFRNGGDEFVLLLLDSDPEGAQEIADRLTSLMQGLTKTLRVDPKPGLSIGITPLTYEPDLTPSALLVRADQALYDRKNCRPKHPGRTVAAPAA